MDYQQRNQTQQEDQLAKTLRGEYDFNVLEVFKRGNYNLTQHFFTLLQSCAVLLLCVIGLSVVLVLTMKIETLDAVTASEQTLIEIVSVFVVAPLQAALYMMGVSIARGKTIVFKDLFSQLNNLFVIALTQLIISFMVKIGMALLILPGIYLWVATIFSLPLVVDKHMTPLKAISLSIKVVNGYLFKMTGVFLFLVVLFSLAFITLGAALIWVAPLYFCVVGVLYNDMFGCGLDAKNDMTTKESSFDA